ncbi:Probable secreted protein [Klebsiella pneumoniae]|nr:Probable secreted protein [Klebsiella pneumoniae]
MFGYHFLHLFTAPWEIIIRYFCHLYFRKKNEIDNPYCLCHAVDHRFLYHAQAADVKAAPAPAQDPIVQHLKLTNDQVAKIKSLHQQLESNVQQISQQEIKDGALINVIHSGKWDEKAVNDQLAAFSKIDQQVRYYRVKYYFEVNKVLTPEQRTQVKKDLADALSE